MPNPTRMPQIEIGDIIQTEQGFQFRVYEIQRIDPGQGAHVRLISHDGQSALDVAVTQVTRRIWRREEPAT